MRAELQDPTIVAMARAIDALSTEVANSEAAAHSTTVFSTYRKIYETHQCSLMAGAVFHDFSSGLARCFFTGASRV